jgi:hypothetical protein
MAGGMLHFAPMTALIRCVYEINGMAEGPVWMYMDPALLQRFGWIWFGDHDC